MINIHERLLSSFRAATWDYKEISGAITNFYDIRGLRWDYLISLGTMSVIKERLPTDVPLIENNTNELFLPF